MGEGDESGLTLVKLGGSLCGGPELRRCLRAIVEAEPGPRLVVPGGGPFADAVRAAQGQLGFDGLAAHRMAILAMQQYGLLLHALEPRLALVEEEAEIAALVAARAAGVWLPWALIGRDATIAASWDVTSDSLALILATRLGAARLILAKAAPVPAAADLAGLAAGGLLDPAFPGLARAFAGRIEVVAAAGLDLTGPDRRSDAAP
jgi:aspartokinase-like uncharacterized kinase